MKFKITYKYILAGFITFTIITYMGIVAESMYHHGGFMQSIIEMHHIIIAVIAGFFCSILAYFYGKRQNKYNNYYIQLKESESKYKSLYNNINDVICLLDNKGNILNINKIGEALFEYTKSEILNMNVSQLVHPLDQEKSKSYFDKLKSEGGYNNYEGRIITKTGKVKWVQINSQEIILNGIKIGSQDIIRDITNSKEDENNIKVNNRLLKELNDTKDKFFSIIAHDLRNPFNNILGFSELLAGQNFNTDNEKQKKLIRLIHENVINVNKLLENLLIWSRSQRGLIKFEPSQVNLFSIISDVIELNKYLLKSKNTYLENRVNDKYEVTADINMLQSILRNLITNAIKFTPKEGHIIISAKLASNNPKLIQLQIKDSGVGIPGNIQEKLFTLSENTHTEGTENEPGTGLGLILCKEFIEKHGQEIWVESKVGEGSTFIFTLQNATSIN